MKLVFGCLTGIQTRSEIRTMSGANLHHGNVLIIRETKCSLRSRSGHYFIHESIIIYKRCFIYPVQLPNLFFYHLVLNANKCRMLSSLGLEAEFACKLGDSMNFCTFL